MSCGNWFLWAPRALSCVAERVEDGMLTLRGSGLRKIEEGMTTVDEVVRETVK